MGGFYVCTEGCWHGNHEYHEGDTVMVEDTALLPQDRDGHVRHFQLVGAETEVTEGPAQQHAMFVSLARRIGFTDDDILGVNPGKGPNGLPLERFGPLYQVLEQRNSVEPIDKAIECLRSIAEERAGVTTLTRSQFETTVSPNPAAPHAPAGGQNGAAGEDGADTAQSRPLNREGLSQMSNKDLDGLAKQLGVDDDLPRRPTKEQYITIILGEAA